MAPGRDPGRMRRVVVIMPSAFTLGNLLFGFWAIVSAYNGNYIWAGWCIVFAAVLDMFDGRIARLYNSGSKFGAELDSLVDLVSFGIAPALLVYFHEFSTAGRFAWLICYFYVVAAALRLARYNVAAGDGSSRPSAWFTGLPSPAAGVTLSVYYAFSQTDWYTASQRLMNLQHQGVAMLMMLLAVLMVSGVKYPRWPAVGFRTRGQLLGLATYLVILAGGLFVPEYFLFPLGLTYMAFGLARTLILALADRPESIEPPDDNYPIHPASDSEEQSA